MRLAEHDRIDYKIGTCYTIEDVIWNNLNILILQRS